MTPRFSQALLPVIALALPLASASGQVYLTDITIFSADAVGNWVGPDIYETRFNENFDIWIQSGTPGGLFLNGPTSADAQPNISLPLGSSTFTLVADPGADFSWFGINLFFNGSVTPSISAFGPMLTTLGPHNFGADSAAVTPPPLGVTLPGAGTLSFTSGNELITLTDFFWATTSVYNLDMAGQYSTGPDGQNDYVGGITFSVTSVPEPQSSLWAIGLLTGAIAAYRRARCQRKN